MPLGWANGSGHEPPEMSASSPIKDVPQLSPGPTAGRSASTPSSPLKLRSIISRESGTPFAVIPKTGLVATAYPTENAMTTKRKWVDVKTVSTYPPKDIFTKDAESIAEAMASKEISPKGIGSGIRMIQFFINRGGKGVTAERKRELETAKHILQEKLKAEAEDDGDRSGK